LKRLLKVRPNGKTGIPVFCRAAAGERCEGRIKVRINARTLGLKKRGQVTVISRRFSLAPGKRFVPARVGKRVRRAVKKRRGITARLRIVTFRADRPNQAINRKIRLRPR
jgi:hypothetical protein